MEASFGKTKLVKLLYLIDVEYYRIHRRLLSGFSWVFYHYGPYALEIDAVLKKLDLDIPQEDVTTVKGYKAIVFKPTQYFGTDFEEQASISDKLVVDHVLAKWGLEELNPLLSHVYFHTEPMEDARRGDILDFSKIRRLSLEMKRKLAEIPADQLKKLREEFQEFKDKATSLKQVYGTLDPEPRFDDVFTESTTYLENEEIYSIPQGDIALEDEFKYLVRQEVEFE